ncbi:hypothetical protein C3L33_21939, partial [Rhododendron williamsianum]
SSLFDESDGSKVDVQGKRVVDVTKLGALERQMFVEKLIKDIENDNLRLLQKMRNRVDNDFCVLNYAKLPGLKSQEAKITIIDDVNGIIKPGRMTLLLGPPGCGKTTLLKALSGNLDKSLKAISAEGQRNTLQTDYILKILGLDICVDTLVGDAMRRDISGDQKKRLTTGEMIIGPTKALFMDEISNGLDSSTTYQIVACLKRLAHITDATILVALLQPAPETFDLFDDIILMEGGKIVYHGPRSHILEFFEDCGFRCPERKGVADFLQEVISRNDQAQYWHQAELSWSYISVDLFCKKFKESSFGKKVDEDLSKPFTKSQSHKNAISFSKYSLSKWDLFRACMSREYLLMRRNSFIYVFKTVQVMIGDFLFSHPRILFSSQYNP